MYVGAQTWEIKRRNNIWFCFCDQLKSVLCGMEMNVALSLGSNVSPPFINILLPSHLDSQCPTYTIHLTHQIKPTDQLADLAKGSRLFLFCQLHSLVLKALLYHPPHICLHSVKRFVSVLVLCFPRLRQQDFTCTIYVLCGKNLSPSPWFAS